MNNVSWLGTFIYDYPHQSPQKYLWKQVTDLPPITTEAWVIIGDLNEITSPNEKDSLSKGSSTRYARFTNVFKLIA